MRRVVIDNLHIDWLNEGRHEDVLFQRDAVKYLSTVVVLELYAGAFSPRGSGLSLTGQRRLDRAVSPSDRRHRNDQQRERLCRNPPRQTVQVGHHPGLRRRGANEYGSPVMSFHC